MLSTLLPVEDEVKEFNKQVLQETKPVSNANAGGVRFGSISKLVPCLVRERSESSDESDDVSHEESDDVLHEESDDVLHEESDDVLHKEGDDILHKESDDVLYKERDDVSHEEEKEEIMNGDVSCATTQSEKISNTSPLESDTCARNTEVQSCNVKKIVMESCTSPNRDYDLKTCQAMDESTDSCFKGHGSSTSPEMTNTQQNMSVPVDNKTAINALEEDQIQKSSTRMSVLSLFHCGKTDGNDSSNSDDESGSASTCNNKDITDDASGYETAPSTMDEDESDESPEASDADESSSHIAQQLKSSPPESPSEEAKNKEDASTAAENLHDTPEEEETEQQSEQQTTSEKPSRSFLPRKREYYNRGLRNLGNTCYLNAAVQMIATLGPFLDELEAYDRESDGFQTQHPVDTERENESTEDEGDNDKPSLRKALLRLAQSLHLLRKRNENTDMTSENENVTESGSVNPSEFKKAMDQLTCLFEGYRQQDSHEFLSTVLDLLQDEILMEEKKRRRRHPSEQEMKRKKVQDAGVGTPSLIEEENRLSIKGKDKLPSFSELDTSDISSLLHGNSDKEQPTCDEPPTSNAAAADRRTAPLLLGGRTAAVATPAMCLSPWTGPQESKIETAAIVSKETAVDAPTQDIVTEEQQSVPTENVIDAAFDAELDAEEVENETKESNGNQEVDDCSRPVESLMSEAQVGEGALDHSEAGQEASSQSSNDAQEEKVSTIRSPVEKHFGALVEVRLVCDSCSYTRSKTEAYRYFSLDINVPGENALGRPGRRCSNNSCVGGVATVEEGLRSFFEPEKIELKCEKCFCENATEYKEIVRLPKVLLLHFKRFIVDFSAAGVTFRKNKSRVEFGEEVCLDSFVNLSGTDEAEEDKAEVQGDRKEEQQFNSSSSSGEDPGKSVDGEDCQSSQDSEGSKDSDGRYVLKSIVHHIGSSASCGHYTADALRHVPADTDCGEEENTRREEEQWLRFNDQTVTEISSKPTNNHTQTTAYMVMYKLVED